MRVDVATYKLNKCLCGCFVRKVNLVLRGINYNYVHRLQKLTNVFAVNTTRSDLRCALTRCRYTSLSKSHPTQPHT